MKGREIFLVYLHIIFVHSYVDDFFFGESDFARENA